MCHLSVSLSVCCLSVMFCIVAKNCLKEQIGNQGQKVGFFGLPSYFYFRFQLYGHQDSCFCLMYCGEIVGPSEKLSEGANRKPWSKSWFFGSPPYFYFWFCLYGHRDGRFCIIFARTAQQSVLDGTNGLSSSKACVYCWIVRSELKPEIVLATIIDRKV